MKTIIVCDEGHLADGVSASRRLSVGLEVQQFYDPIVAEDSAAVDSAKQDIVGLEPLTLHGPFGDLCPGSFDPMIRDATRHRFELGATVAAHLGASHVVFHHGYVPGTSRPAGWIRRCSLYWRDFLNGKPSSTQFHNENMLEHGPEILREVLDAVDAPNFTACFDIGHGHCHSLVTPLRWVEELGTRIGYVHIHNNHGNDDEHLAPYDGTLDVAEVLRALNVRRDARCGYSTLGYTRT